MKRASITQLAAELGVSAMSVSVALRGKPGVSEKLRARILKRARELGYRPDPVAAELMAIMRARRRAKGAETIAFLNTFSDPALFDRIAGLQDFVTGARERAAAFGYRLEVFNARQRGWKGERLARVLKARGVRGVLVGPRWRTEPDIDFPWGDFSVVLVGEAEYGPNLYRVCNHHIHTCTITLNALVARGYRRIGLELVKDDESKRGYDYLLGVDQFRRSAPPGVEVHTLLLSEHDDGGILNWVAKRGIDVLVTLGVPKQDLVDNLASLPEGGVGYANLNLPKGSAWSGVDQHTEEVGSASVDLLRNLLMEGERGMPSRPRIVLVEGNWVEGATTPGPRAESSARPKKNKRRTVTSRREQTVCHGPRRNQRPDTPRLKMSPPPEAKDRDALS